jgi:hydroxymethylbilane synthase
MKTIRLAGGADPIGLLHAARVERKLACSQDPIDVSGVLVESSRDPEEIFDRLAATLFDGSADAAAFAASSLPLRLPLGLDLAAVFREDHPRYRCLAHRRPSLDDLPAGSKVITCDPISRAQVLIRYPGLRVETGVPGTEVCEGLRHGVWAAACVPPEAIELGSLWGLEIGDVPAEDIVPIVGLGATAILAPTGRTSYRARLEALGDHGIEACLRAERIFLRHVPRTASSVAAASARIRAGRIEIIGLFAGREGEWLAIDQAEGPEAHADAVALDLAQSCADLALARSGEPVLLDKKETVAV